MTPVAPLPNLMITTAQPVNAARPQANCCGAAGVVPMRAVPDWPKAHQGGSVALPTRLDTCTSLPGVRVWLGPLNECELLAMVDDGRLVWVINVASDMETRRELRVPLVCIRDYLAGNSRDYAPEEIAAILFGPEPQPISAQCFYRALAIRHVHGYALHRRNDPPLMNPRQVRRGPGGGGLIAREAVIEFLEGRRVL